MRRHRRSEIEGEQETARVGDTWWQEVGGSGIAASKECRPQYNPDDEEYTVQFTRQEELTRLIQERVASVGQKQPVVVQ